MGQTTPKTMQAAAIDRFGGIETITPQTLPVPEVGPDEVLIRVESAEPRGDAPALSAIENANLLVVMDTDHEGTVAQGGTYDAYLTFRWDGSQMLPILSDVAATK